MTQAVAIPDWLAGEPEWAGPGAPKVVHLSEQQYATRSGSWRGGGFAVVRPFAGHLADTQCPGCSDPAMWRHPEVTLSPLPANEELMYCPFCRHPDSRVVDEVAYLRLASVYRRFESLGDFEDEINALRQGAPRPGSRGLGL